MGRRLGIKDSVIREAFLNFAGVKRRQEIRREKGFLLIDDFAHHPSAVAQTIKAVRLFYPDREIWAVFEPRSATSHLNTFQSDWPDAFAGADLAFVCELFNPTKFAADKTLNVKRIVDEIKPESFYAKDTTEMFDLVAKKLRNQNGLASKKQPIVLVMSNGGFGGLVDKLVELKL